MEKTPLQEFGPTIAVPRSFVTLTGSTNAALLLAALLLAVVFEETAEAISEMSLGVFPAGLVPIMLSRESVRLKTGLTRTQQEFARRRLRAFDFWAEERVNFPASLSVTLNLTRLRAAVDKARVA